MTTETGSEYLDLYDYRRRVFAMYRRRNESLQRGDEPAAVCNGFRIEKDALFATHPQSAYDAEHRRRFSGLDYFPYDPEFRVEAIVESNVAPERLMIQTSAEESMPMTLAGVARFRLSDEPHTLAIYWIDVYGGGLFLPFRDTTSPAETYGGGRYLVDTVKGSDFEDLAEDGSRERILLDFNYAYNPSCAYDYRWSCPLAPPRNQLAVPIRAGEKTPR